MIMCYGYIVIFICYKNVENVLEKVCSRYCIFVLFLLFVRTLLIFAELSTY